MEQIAEIIKQIRANHKKVQEDIVAESSPENLIKPEHLEADERLNIALEIIIEVLEKKPEEILDILSLAEDENTFAIQLAAMNINLIIGELAQHSVHCTECPAKEAGACPDTHYSQKIDKIYREKHASK